MRTEDRQGNLDMGFPAYYLIDRNGRVTMRGSGWDKTGMIGCGDQPASEFRGLTLELGALIFFASFASFA